MTDILDFARLNSATKYPSIRTYHALDGRGNVMDNTSTIYAPGSEVVVTEKVNGTNTRIVFFPDGDYVIGAREHLLYAKGDRLINPEHDIVQTLIPIAERIKHDPDGGNQIVTFFLEVYGGSVGKAAHQYTAKRALGARLFDVAITTADVLDWPVEAISTWRKSGGQRWFTEATLGRAAAASDIPLVPRLATLKDVDLPGTLWETYDYMVDLLPATRVALDDRPDAGGNAEGIVLRSKDRRVITKARFDDYRKVLFPEPPRKSRPQRGQTVS
jgi:hypothetical protein